MSKPKFSNELKITKGQIKVIHTLKNRLGWDDAQYRGFLMWNSKGFVTSSKELSYEEAERIIFKMKWEAIRKGVWEERPRKYDDLNGREGMATGAQLRKIEALWAEVCDFQTEKDRKRTLRKFLWKRFGVSDLRFLDQWQVKKVIKALEVMRWQKENKKISLGGGAYGEAK